jgi:hypothetical protein
MHFAHKLHLCVSYDCHNKQRLFPCIVLARVSVTVDGVLDWMIGFIDTSVIHLGTTGKYSAIADVHTVQLTLTYTLGFSVFTSRILATGFITVSLSLQIVFFSPPNSFLAIILQLPTQFSSSAPKLISREAGVSKLDSTLLLLLK